MNQELRMCQNCKQEFTVEPEDFDFYEKIQVPAPTFCPECRFIRRMAWRSESKLYRRKDDATGNIIFSSFPDMAPVKIYHRDYWWSDSWDPMQYGRDIDWNKPFIIQIGELMKEVPLPSGAVINVTNCDYCMNLGYSKNSYLCFGGDYAENCAYLVMFLNSKESYDCDMVRDIELCYDSLNLVKCYRTLFSVDCEECQDVIFSKDCISCSNCFGCVNLRNKSFHIFNEPYSKEDYFEKLKELNLDSFSAIKNLRLKAHEFWNKFPRKYMHERHNTDVSGDYVYYSKNAHYCYKITGGENIKYCQNLLKGPVKDSYDYSNWGDGSELIYDSYQCGENTYDLQFCWASYKNNKGLRYCIFCNDSSNLFGCVGVRNKQYCILNKQYTKDEYERLIPQIVEHMKRMPYIDTVGRKYAYGEFFPIELSPFPYNETVAQEYRPLTQKEVSEQGLTWMNPQERNYTITLKSNNIPDRIKDIDGSILKEVIGCMNEGRSEGCTTAFKIIESELSFYKKMNISLPRLCVNCRRAERLKHRNPFRLFDRTCGKCGKDIKTSYSSDCPETVYCGECYQKEVV